MRCMEKLGTIGKHISNLRANCDEEKQKVLQLELDVFHVEKEAKETELATMDGSEGGKHSKGRGKSKLMKNETCSTTSEALNSKHDLAQTSKDKAQGLRDLLIKASSRYTDSNKDGSSGLKRK